MNTKYLLMMFERYPQDWLKAASILTGLNVVEQQAGVDGNTLDIVMDAHYTHEHITELYRKMFPRDPNKPLPGQLDLPLGDPQ